MLKSFLLGVLAIFLRENGKFCSKFEQNRDFVLAENMFEKFFEQVLNLLLFFADFAFFRG